MRKMKKTKKVNKIRKVLNQIRKRDSDNTIHN